MEQAPEGPQPGPNTRHRFKACLEVSVINRKKTEGRGFLEDKPLFFRLNQRDAFVAKQELHDARRGYQPSYNLLPHTFHAIPGVSQNPPAAPQQVLGRSLLFSIRLAGLRLRPCS